MGKLRKAAVTLFRLSYRNFQLFMKDRLTVFFSLLSPLIVLLLYVLFLGDVQADTLRSIVPAIIGDKAIRAVADSWLIAGVLGVSCLTVSASAASTVVSDKVSRALDDFNASPSKPYLIGLSYFLSCFAITFLINFIIMTIGLIYLAVSGSFMLSVGALFEIVGIIILSCLSSTLLMTVLVGFFKSENAVGGFNGILSAVSGFLIGAYMPMSIFPLGIQYVCALLPASYSAMLFRNVLLEAPVADMLKAGMPEQFAAKINENFSVNLNFFGVSASKAAAYIVVALSVVVFLFINVLTKKLRKKV